MSVTAKPLINSKYASNSATNEYQCPTAKYAIIDKFTATNTDASSRTVSVYLVPSGGSAGESNLIVSALSISAGATSDLSDYLKNHILSAGDAIYVLASVASEVTIRCSGREIT